MKKSLFIILVSIFVFSSDKSKATSFYSGLSIGESEAKINNYGLDKKRAFTFSIGSLFQIPLFPIRLEAEYLRFNSRKENVYDVRTYGTGINGYVNLPLLPILVPYIGIGLSYLKEKLDKTDYSQISDKKFVPQYIFGIDLDLPTVTIAGSIEYRYINTKFDIDNENVNSKYHIFLFKTRLKF